uniref:Uncharacterized protein n=1 Tax=Populus trichocarpa TaxID=3694 RepID=A0A3N7FT36_POPTR
MLLNSHVNGPRTLPWSMIKLLQKSDAVNCVLIQ